ncbi:hypothetical protein CROQUDRAFT_514784 [Cronartium quercuum f. sp. fusiforme G11]|uniref:Uncharacterized protein n=1 Tax=Cronartium quercuum f. sp. fusiforme G11 TaxID=708437 RepID=A0A9P6NN95_9BASI|nr:hypothetical protein CROQUDRAFT_514784 [Cronartium quercuum f. sp. fusiforme G11]
MSLAQLVALLRDIPISDPTVTQTESGLWDVHHLQFGISKTLLWVHPRNVSREIPTTFLGCTQDVRTSMQHQPIRAWLFCFVFFCILISHEVCISNGRFQDLFRYADRANMKKGNLTRNGDL